MFAQKKSLTIKVLLAAMVLSTMAGIVATSAPEAKAGGQGNFNARTAEIYSVTVYWRNPHTNQFHQTRHFTARHWYWNGHSWINHGVDDGGISRTAQSLAGQNFYYHSYSGSFWRWGTW